MFPSDTDFESTFSFETDAVPLAEESPFHILLLGNWSGNKTRKPLDERRLIEIDRDNFDEILHSFGVELKISLPNHEESDLTLKFENLDDFHPDNLFRGLSFFSDLRELRQQLLDPDTYNLAAREIRHRYSASNRAAESPNEESDQAANFDQSELLEQILTGSETPQKTDISNGVKSSELNSLVAGLVSPHIIKFDVSEQADLLQTVDSAIGDSMQNILHHPEFQEMESAWRGLYFLVRRIETSSNLKIFILDVSKTELVTDLKSAANLSDTFIYQFLSSAQKDYSNPLDPSVLAGNYSFNVDVDDVAALMRLAKIAEAFNAPFISYLKSECLLKTSTSHNAHADKLWNLLRSIDEAAFIGLSAIKYLGRLPYGENSEPVETFSFEEVAPSNEPQYLWFNPCFLITLFLAKSFQQHAWQIGNSFSEYAEKFPLYFHETSEGVQSASLIDFELTEQKFIQLIELGLIPLFTSRNSDKVQIPKLPSVHLSGENLRGKWNL